MFEKRKRIENRSLLDAVARLPCLANRCYGRGSDPHHVTTVKAGGDDVPENVMPLCRAHHTEWHKVGPGKMIEQYSNIERWLKQMGRFDVLERAKRGAYGNKGV